MSPLTTKAKVLLSLVALVVSCAVSFGAAWTYQGARWKASEATLQASFSDEREEAAQAALKRYKDMEKQKDDALKERETELAKAQADAAKSAATASGLRKQLSKVPALIESATESALREYAITSSELLGSCTAEYQRMADIAQRHAVDVKALIAAWPKN